MRGNVSICCNDKANITVAVWLTRLENPGDIYYYFRAEEMYKAVPKW